MKNIERASEKSEAPLNTPVCEQLNTKRRGETEKGAVHIFKDINSWKPLVFTEKNKLHILEAQQTQSNIYKSRFANRHIIVQMLKIRQGENLEIDKREKQWLSTYKGTIRLTADFKVETMEARRQWKHIYKMFKEKQLLNMKPISIRVTFQTRELNTDFPR